jgi:hypothetical protein
VRLGGASIGGIAAASVCALALASPADAGSPGPTVSLGSAGPIEYLKATSANVNSQSGSPAECNGGDAVTGGGGAVSGPGENAGLNATAPIDVGGSGWMAQGRTTGVDPRKVHTYAICSPEAGGWSTGTSPLDATGQTNDTLAATESCGPGETIFGGISGSGGDVRVISTHPDADEWHSFVQNRSLSSANATSWRQCTTAYEPQAREGVAKAKIKGEKSGKATARCKPDEAVLAGGVEIAAGGEPARHTWTTATRPWDSEDRKKVPDDGWLVKAYNYNSDGKVKLTAFALCVPR